MINKKISIIGVGNMGSAIARGIISKKIVSKNKLILSSTNKNKLTAFENSKIIIAENNADAVKQSDIVILAVKPQIAKHVLNDVKESFSENHLLISVMAGISTVTIAKILQKNVPIIRSMPNLCASAGKSMTGWFANSHVCQKDKKITKMLLQSIGSEIEIRKEADIDSITAISGSGPAYFFYLTEIMMEAAKELGLAEDILFDLIKNTLEGSAKVLSEAKEDPKVLRQRVTSKGGTTEAAFNVLYKKNIARMFIEAIKSARNRAAEINKLYE